jgi:fibronectin type 3 domain-containing protein
MNRFRNSLLAATLAVCSGSLFAQGQAGQNPLPLFNSAGGPVLLFGGSSINSAGKDSKGIHYTISRSEVNGNGVKQLALPGMVKNYAAFKKMVGATFVAQLVHQLKLKTEDALWGYLQQHSDLSAYAFASFNIPFRVAMGAAYIDEEVKGQKGRSYTYKITVDGGQAAGNGRAAEGGQAAGTGSAPNGFAGTLTIGEAPDLAAPVTSQVKAKDSLVSIVWKSKLRRDIPYFAEVYRQNGGRGDFYKLPARILAKRKGDSVTYLFTDKVNGNSAYRYYIRPADLLNNTGAYNSDTASLVAANFMRLPLLSGLQAKDTLNAILLSWQPLAANPLITGIEIQRSRDPRGDYVIIDTVSALTHGYLDKRLLPHIGYYYRLCVLHAGKQLQTEKFYTPVSAEQQKTSHIPDAPYSIVVQTTPRGVAVAWRPIDDPDLFAYFVYRGTSLQSKMQVISPALTDTVFTDTASNLSSHTSYVYAVKAVSNGNKESVFSAKMAAHLPKGRERPVTPGGISLVPRDGQLAIQWEDTKKNDPGVMGYILYKYKTGKQALQYDVTKPASAEATRLGLSLVVAGVIRAPHYEDTIPRNGDRYEYLVSAIDVYGAESGLSPVASSAPFGVQQARPPVQVFARSVKEGVSLQWEQADLAGVQGFAIYRRAIADKKSRKIAQVGAAASQYTDKQTAQGVLYVYTVATLTAAGETGPSDERTVKK